MKRKIFFVLLMLSAITLICISCVTKPHPPEPSKAVSNEAKDKADKARKQAMDFDSNTYFPTEWAEAEKQYSSATDDASYKAAEDAYNALLRKPFLFMPKQRKMK